MHTPHVNGTGPCMEAAVDRLPDDFLLVSTVYLFALSVVAAAENAMVIYTTVKRRRQLRQTIGRVFLALAITDLVTSLVAMPAYATVVLRRVCRLPTNCELNFVTFSFGYVVAIVSMMTITMVSVNRLVAVLKPHLFRSVSYGWAWLTGFALIWIYAVVIVIPTFLGVLPFRVFTLLFALTIGLALVLSVTAYVYIFKYSRQSANRIGEISSKITDNASASYLRNLDVREQRISRACLKASVLLLLMYMPLMVTRLFNATGTLGAGVALQAMLLVSNASMLTNSAVNPWIYAGENLQLRRLLTLSFVTRTTKIAPSDNPSNIMSHRSPGSQT